MTRNLFIAQAALLAVGYALWHFGNTGHVPYITMAMGYIWRMIHERRLPAVVRKESGE